jgi:hypothetical protein
MTASTKNVGKSRFPWGCPGRNLYERNYGERAMTPETCLAALATNTQVPWTSAEVWREVQTGVSESQADDVVRGDLESLDWPEDDDEAYLLRDTIEETSIKSVNDILASAWKGGGIVRCLTFGGGGEWALPGTPAARYGLTASQWPSS